MIEVEGLTKRYGERTAISGLTFQANKGEVVGFLGPNGAGKTTTMRILTGYMPPSEGRGKVAGVRQSYPIYYFPTRAYLLQEVARYLIEMTCPLK